MRFPIACTIALTMLFAVSAGAQEEPTLNAVETLASSGRSDEARDMLLAWWSSVRDDASRRDVQRGFWLRGRLTVDPAQAELDFQRLVIEFPGGPYSDLALLRLAQAAFAMGDSSAAATHVMRLTQEYPGSAVRREAEAWLATAGPSPLGATTGDATAENDAPTEVPPPENPPADSVADTPVSPEAVAPPVTEGSDAAIYAVQLGAFANETRARSVVGRAADAGFAARLARVEGSRLLHVRVGRFDSSAEADVILDRLRGLGFSAAIVRNAHREERTGR